RPGHFPMRGWRVPAVLPAAADAGRLERSAFRAGAFEGRAAVVGGLGLFRGAAGAVRGGPSAPVVVPRMGRTLGAQVGVPSGRPAEPWNLEENQNVSCTGWA